MRALRRLVRHALGAAAVLLLGVTVITTVAIYIAESAVNPDAGGLPEALWWTVGALLGRQLFAPQTDAGQTVDFVLLIVRPGLFGVITAAVTARFLQLVMWRDSGLGRARMNNHIVICGWSALGHEIIGEIRGRNPDAAPPIAILADLDAAPFADHDVRFVRGDPTSAEDLKRAGIERARTALVLADNSYQGVDAENMDSRSLLTVLAIESLRAACYTCVEVVRMKNREHFERTQADEILVSGRLTGGLLAHSAVTHGLSKVIGDLITFPEGNEFYWIEAGSDLVGKTFADALAALKRDLNCVVVAVARAGQDYVTNPPGELQLQADDRLLVIAEGQPVGYRGGRAGERS